VDNDRKIMNGEEQKQEMVKWLSEAKREGRRKKRERESRLNKRNTMRQVQYFQIQMTMATTEHFSCTELRKPGALKLLH
jgi:hypothetical protein